MIRKTIVALALIVSLATVAKADTIQVVGGSNSGATVIINHTKNESTSHGRHPGVDGSLAPARDPPLLLDPAQSHGPLERPNGCRRRALLVGTHGP